MVVDGTDVVVVDVVVADDDAVVVVDVVVDVVVGVVDVDAVVVVDVGASSASWAYQEQTHSSPQEPCSPYHIAPVLLHAQALTHLAAAVDTSFVRDSETVVGCIA